MLKISAAVKREVLRTGVVAAWVTVAAIVIAASVPSPVREFVEGLAPSDDWSQFAPDSMAALLAVVVGIPVGLWISRQIEYVRRREERAQRKERLRRVLAALAEEVKYNKKQLDGTIAFEGQPHEFLPLFDYRTEVWQALSASGDLGLIEDPALLSQLAVAAYTAEGVNAWRRPLRENYASLEYPRMNMGAETAARVWPQLKHAAEEAARIHNSTLTHLDRALALIETERQMESRP